MTNRSFKRMKKVWQKWKVKKGYFIGEVNSQCSSWTFIVLIIRGSCLLAFHKIGVFKSFTKFREKHFARISFLIKCRLEACYFIKTETLFHVTFAKILRTAFLIEHFYRTLFIEHFYRTPFLYNTSSLPMKNENQSDIGH